MFWNGYHVHSSLVASRKVHDDMLTFSARNGVKPALQEYKNTGGDVFQKIFSDLDSNKVRYRAVVSFE